MRNAMRDENGKGINMVELKLKKLHRGYVLTDFDGNDIGIKDSEQAMQEIKKLVMPEDGSEQSVAEQPIKEKRRVTVELQREIFEKAKEQISLVGRVSKAKISRDLGINPSTVHNHLKKMNAELEELIKKWQDEHDKSALVIETRTDLDNDKVS